LVQENGLSVSTHYSNKNGSLSVESLPQGTSFTCEISVKNTTQSAVSNIALTQFVPSGWEIVNTRFTDYDTDSSKWDYADIRDDRAHIYFGLKAGETKKFTLQLNASYKGTYYLPGSFAEAMYDAKYNTHNKGSWIKVE
jgi:alpha-2-macroglobulin domain protein